jgi:serine/threonine protein kinase
MDSTVITPASDELPADSQIGPYRVVRLLGKGGMGLVYEAVHSAIQRRVAIKLLRSELASDKERAARFVNEARAVNLIEHPGVVQVADMGQQADGTPYIVMEFLRGETLSGLLKRRPGPLPWAEVLGYGQQILDVLRAAHEKGIVHREPKRSEFASRNGSCDASSEWVRNVVNSQT